MEKVFSQKKIFAFSFFVFPSCFFVDKFLFPFIPALPQFKNYLFYFHRELFSSELTLHLHTCFQKKLTGRKIK